MVENDDWADAPLTEEEEEGLRQGRENVKNGDYMTLEEFRKSQDDWVDAPLTPDEEAQIEESDREYENGEYLTIDELMEGVRNSHNV